MISKCTPVAFRDQISSLAYKCCASRTGNNAAPLARHNFAPSGMSQATRSCRVCSAWRAVQNPAQARSDDGRSPGRGPRARYFRKTQHARGGQELETIRPSAKTFATRGATSNAARHAHGFFIFLFASRALGHRAGQYAWRLIAQAALGRRKEGGQ